MTHDRAQDLLLDLAYGELSPGDAREVERHAAECDACAAEWRRIGEARAVAAKVAEERVPARGREAIVEAARAAGAAPRPRPRRRRATWALASAAALLVVGVTVKLAEAPPRPSGDLMGSPAAPAEAPAEAPGGAAAPLRGPPPAAQGEGDDEVREEPVTRAERPRGATPLPGPPPAAKGEGERKARERQTASAPPPRSGAKQRAAEAPPAAAPIAEDRERARGDRPAFAAKRAAPAPGLAQAPAAAASAGAAAGGAADASLAVAAEVDRREAAGELSRSVRRAACASGDVEWVALVDGAGRVLKLSVRTSDGAVRTGWYDAAGTLRRAVMPPAGDELRLPARDPGAAFAAAQCPP